MPNPTAEAFANAPMKRIALYGMSGVGKSHIASMLRAEGGWYHYSVDYRIGTRHMGESIIDALKKEAMASPRLKKLLLSGSVAIESRLAIDNLEPLADYLGAPGSPAGGGLPFAEFVRRQRQHREAEIMAMIEAPSFIEKAKALYGCDNVVCDMSGSMVEVVDPDDPHDPLMSELTRHMVFVFIRGGPEDREELIRRFEADPKPIYYDETLLRGLWSEYLEAQSLTEDIVTPQDFARWAFRRLIEHRAPRYEALARRWGVSISKADVAKAANSEDFLALIAEALAQANAQ